MLIYCVYYICGKNSLLSLIIITFVLALFSFLLQNIDLHALTGWIPERVAIKSSAKPFDKDKEFQKIMTKFHQGDCVVTVATGALPEQEADRAGLVVSHAYAMLDIREVFVSLYSCLLILRKLGSTVKNNCKFLTRLERHEVLDCNFSLMLLSCLFTFICMILSIEIMATYILFCYTALNVGPVHLIHFSFFNL